MGSNLKICLSQHRQVSPNSEVWTCENGRRTVLHSVAYDVCQVQPGNQSSKFPVETRPMSSRCFFWRRGMERIFRVVCRLIQSQDCLTYQCLSLVAFDVRFTCVTSAAVRMLQLCFERHARGMHAAPCGPRDCYLRRTYRI